VLTLVTLNSRKRKGEGRAVVGLLSASSHSESSPKAGRLCHSVPSSEGQPAWKTSQPWALTKMVSLVSWSGSHLESAIRMKGSQAHIHKLDPWILIYSNNGLSYQRWGGVCGEQGNALHLDLLSRY